MHRRAPTTTGPSPLPAYRNSPQSDGLKLVPKEIQSSPAVEGELPEDGLAAYGDDLMLAPARKIMSGAEEDDAKTQQSQFSRAGFLMEEPAAKRRSRKPPRLSDRFTHQHLPNLLTMVWPDGIVCCRSTVPRSLTPPPWSLHEHPKPKGFPTLMRPYGAREDSAQRCPSGPKPGVSTHLAGLTFRT